MTSDLVETPIVTTADLGEDTTLIDQVGAGTFCEVDVAAGRLSLMLGDGELFTLASGDTANTVETTAQSALALLDAEGTPVSPATFARWVTTRLEDGRLASLGTEGGERCSCQIARIDDQIDLAFADGSHFRLGDIGAGDIADAAVLVRGTGPIDLPQAFALLEDIEAAFAVEPTAGPIEPAAAPIVSDDGGGAGFTAAPLGDLAGGLTPTGPLGPTALTPTAPEFVATDAPLTAFASIIADGGEPSPDETALEPDTFEEAVDGSPDETDTPDQPDTPEMPDQPEAPATPEIDVSSSVVTAEDTPLPLQDWLSTLPEGTTSVVLSDLPDGASLSHGFDHGDGSWTLGPDDFAEVALIPPADQDLDFEIEATVMHGDQTGVVESGGVLNVRITPEIDGAEAADLNEADLTNGVAEAVAIADASPDVSVRFLAQNAPEGLTSGGEPVRYEVIDDGATLVAVAGTAEVLRLEIGQNGAVAATMSGPLDHPGVGVGDQMVLRFAFEATDRDGDTVQDRLNVNVTDDVPVIEGQTSLLTGREQSGRLIFDHGGDGPGTLLVSNGTDDIEVAADAVIDGRYGTLGFDGAGGWTYSVNEGVDPAASFRPGATTVTTLNGDGSLFVEFDYATGEILRQGAATGDDSFIVGGNTNLAHTADGRLIVVKPGGAIYEVDTSDLGFGAVNQIGEVSPPAREEFIGSSVAPDGTFYLATSKGSILELDLDDQMLTPVADLPRIDSDLATIGDKLFAVMKIDGVRHLVDVAKDGSGFDVIGEMPKASINIGAAADGTLLAVGRGKVWEIDPDDASAIALPSVPLAGKTDYLSDVAARRAPLEDQSPDARLETFTFRVTDADGDQASADLQIWSAPDAAPALLAPLVFVETAEGREDREIELDIRAIVQRPFTGEIIESLTVKGVPAEATLSAGERQADGSWLLSPRDLKGLTLTPETDSDVDFTLTVEATMRAADGRTAQAETQMEVVIEAVADVPSLLVDVEEVDEGTFDLSVEAELNDTDGSESLDVVIRDLPPGAQLIDEVALQGDRGFFITQAVEAEIVFQGETAGYRNSLLWYKISDEGEITQPQMIWENGSKRGSGGDLIIGESRYLFDLEAGDRIGFAIVADGNRQNDYQSFGEGRYLMLDSAGRPATIDGEPPVLWFERTDGERIEVEGPVYHLSGRAGAGINPDGAQHSEVEAKPEPGVLTIGFEDLPNLGDADFDDVLFTLRIGEVNVAAMGEGVEPAGEGTFALDLGKVDDLAIVAGPEGSLDGLRVSASATEAENGDRVTTSTVIEDEPNDLAQEAMALFARHAPMAKDENTTDETLELGGSIQEPTAGALDMEELFAGDEGDSALNDLVFGDNEGSENTVMLQLDGQDAGLVRLMTLDQILGAEGLNQSFAG